MASPRTVLLPAITLETILGLPGTVQRMPPLCKVALLLTHAPRQCPHRWSQEEASGAAPPPTFGLVLLPGNRSVHWMISAAFRRAMQRGGASKSHVLVPENVVFNEATVYQMVMVYRLQSRRRASIVASGPAGSEQGYGSCQGRWRTHAGNDSVSVIERNSGYDPAAQDNA